MEQTDMTMTRTQYEHTCAVKAGIIHALRDNLGDEFSAKEIAASMAWPSDLEPMQVGAILKSMVAEGLVTRRRQHDGNLYQLHKRALAWTPPEYDWRVARSNPVAKTKPPAAGKVNGAPVLVPPATPARKKPKPPASKPADDHPWVHPPAVMPTIPKAAPITRPLPAHLETPVHSPASPDPGALDLDADDLAAMALPEAPIAPAFGTGSFLLANPPFEASRQLVVDNCTASGQAILDDSSYSEIPNSSETNDPEIPDSSPAAVVAHEAPIDAQQTLPAESHEDEPPAHRGCGGHCANHARASDDQELTQALERALAEIGIQTENLEALEDQNAALIRERDAARGDLAISQRDLEGALAKINALAVELEALEDRNACLADDLAISQQERDRLHEQVRAYARQHTEDQNRIDALMDVARPHLAKGKHGDTARAAAPFGLPVIPKDWIGLLKLTKLVLKIDNEGGGAYATLKVDAALNQGEADFTPGLTNGLIGLLYYLLPHLAISPPDHFADTGNMVGSEARP